METIPGMVDVGDASGEGIYNSAEWALITDEARTLGTSSDSGPASDIASPDDAPDQSRVTTRMRRKPIPRKGHTKSRRGCYSCKKRKVKCQETLPECENCTRLGLGCVYPKPPASLDPSSSPGPSTLSVSPSLSVPLQPTPTTFNMDDFRYFHHFLLTAYPPLPMQGDEIWKDVAAISHSVCTFLSHTVISTT